MPAHIKELNSCFSMALLASSLYLGAANAQTAYVANLAGNNVTVVVNGSVATSIPVAAGPAALAVTPKGDFVYVVSESANSVAVIRTSDNTVVGNIGVGSFPTALAISPDGSQVYVTNQGSNQVSVIQDTSVVATINVGLRPAGVAFSSDGSKPYITNMGDGTVSIINTSTRGVSSTFAVQSGPSAVTVSSTGHLYVTNQYSGSVTVHDLAGNLQATIGGFVSPKSVAVTPDGTKVFVANANGGSATAIDGNSNSVLATIPLGLIPTSVAITPDGRYAYVTNEYSFSLSVIDISSNALVNTITRVGVYPVAVAMIPSAAQTPLPAPPVVVPPVVVPPVVPPVVVPVICSVSISAVSLSYSQGAVSGNVTMGVSPSNCAWTATSDSSTLSVSGQGTGNGSANFSGSRGNVVVSGQSPTGPAFRQSFSVTGPSSTNLSSIQIFWFVGGICG